MANILDEILADVPVIKPTGITRNIYPGGRIWVDYDKEADDFAMFFNDEARRGIYVPIEGGLNAIVHPVTYEIVGFYVVGWKQRYVRHNADLAAIWKEMEQIMGEQQKSLLSQIWDALRSLGAPLSDSDRQDFHGAPHPV